MPKFNSRDYEPREDLNVEASLINAALLLVAGGNDLTPRARERVTDAAATVVGALTIDGLDESVAGFNMETLTARREKAGKALGEYLLMSAQGALEMPLDLGDTGTGSH